MPCASITCADWLKTLFLGYIVISFAILASRITDSDACVLSLATVKLSITKDNLV